MTRLCTLFSGSRGNSTYLQCDKTSILIDSGVSCKAVTGAVKQLEMGMEDISGIVITHEHTDHIKGLKVITKRLDMPIYATSKVLEFLSDNSLVNPKTKLISVDDGNFSIGNIGVESFATSHDSVGSSGFRFTMFDGEKVGFATDLGVYTKEVEDMLSGCKAVVLESNYDEAMLACSLYPYAIKRRIKSPMGHLSNAECASASKNLIKKGTKHIILAHLSQENNMPRLARETTKSSITELGAVYNEDYTLQTAPPKMSSSIIEL